MEWIISEHIRPLPVEVRVQEDCRIRGLERLHQSQGAPPPHFALALPPARAPDE